MFVESEYIVISLSRLKFIEKGEKMNDLKIELNAEVHNVGEFLYIGCEGIYQTGPAILDYEIFNIFYNLSVGIERIQKIILVLNREGLNERDQSFLVRHNLQELQNILKRDFNIIFSKNENKLLELLSDFYNNGRYHYLDKKFQDNYVQDWSIKRLDKFFKEAKLETITSIGPQFLLPYKSKECLLKSLDIIISKYIKILKEESENKSIYVHETQSNFKFSIFYYGSILEKSNIFDYFEMVDITKNELSYFLLKDTLEIKDTEFDTLKEYPILDIDPALIKDFISEKTLFKVKNDFIEHVESCYEELYEDDSEKLKERKYFMKNFWNYYECVIFGDEDE